MENDTSKKKKVYKKLRNKYRLVILNDDTFEERLSFQLTPLNVFTYAGLTLITLGVFLISIIAFTPLREYIPGYSDVTTKKNAAYAVFKADSLHNELLIRDQYIENVRLVLSGDIKPDSIDADISPQNKFEDVEDERSDADSAFRAKIEKEEQYTINQNLSDNKSASTYFFFTPVKGVVSSSFNPDVDHYGVDVVTEENEAIKAVMDGTVIMANWTTDNGYVLQIQHRNNLVSVYKHCSALMKKIGESVKAGEPVAIVGNSGEQSTGPHLHFEIWDSGKPVDPQQYISF
tara:strand:- start:739 stop:1605 length:867 start_codon:yes stop_codon:yes gene_type:complete